MKIIWYSTAPFVGCGYGVLSRALCKRMIADGHQVKIATKHHLGGQLVVEGIEVFDGIELGLINKVAEEENYDYVFSVMDQWTLPADFSFKNWVAVNFLDTEFIHHSMISTLKRAKYNIAVTQHDKKECSRVGINSYYAPLGADTSLFKPNEEARKKYRAKMGWNDDTIVFGLVGINYSTDRKNIVNTLRAFQGFHKNHPNSALYLHTDVMGTATKGLPLMWIINACGFNSEGKGPIYYADQKRYHLWNISQEELAGLYNAFDVFCLPSQGEGFGMPWVEAQACGCPVINVDTTSGKELNFGGYLIPQQEDYYRFSTLMTWYVMAPPSVIEDEMEKAYKEWENGTICKRKRAAREGALEYEWDAVYEKYWRPFLKDLELKTIHVNTMPNYGTEIYEKYHGKVLMEECFDVCGNKECLKLTDKFPRFDGEWEGPRSVLGRSYPIFPVPPIKQEFEGGFYVDVNCPFYRLLSPRFIKETKEMWKKLFSYPSIRKQYIKMWDEGLCKNSIMRTLEDEGLVIDFDDTYAKAMQSRFFTTFQYQPEMLKVLPKGAKILDVGAGDGKRVEYLNSIGFDAIGAEINMKWVNDDTIVYNDIRHLDFPDNSFDMVSCIDVLEHIPETIQAISELFRVSRKYVIIQATSTNDSTFFEDASHCVEWSSDRWDRELLEFGNIIKKYSGSTYLMEKK